MKSEKKIALCTFRVFLDVSACGGRTMGQREYEMKALE